MKMNKFTFWKIATLITFLSISVGINAQTFKCTSVEFSDEVSIEDQQKEKKKMLGATLEYEMFENDIKVTISYVYREKPKKEIEIFSKNGNTYELEIDRDKAFLNFEKTLGFVRGVIITICKYKEQPITIKFEREYF